MEMKNPLQWAGWLLAQGFNVIPGKLSEKRPVIPWLKYQSEKATKQDLKAWFLFKGGTWPFVVCGDISHLVVVDCDSDSAMDYMFRELPDTKYVWTGKGCHGYFIPPPSGMGLHPGFLVDGVTLDIKGQGSYVVGPGALHETGAVYEHWNWNQPMAMLPLDWCEASGLKRKDDIKKSRKKFRRVDLDIDPWMVVDRLEDKEERIKQGQTFLKFQLPAIEGQGGNNHTFTLVCTLMHEYGLSPDEIHCAIGEWNLTCEPTWDFEELDMLIHNAAYYGG
jgi:hypothetical protein